MTQETNDDRVHQALEGFTQSNCDATDEEGYIHMLRTILNPERNLPWIQASGKYPLLKTASRRIASLLGGTAYFVGSARESLTRPRDVDVRIVLSDATFTERYNLTPETWQEENRTCQWSHAHWYWYREEERYRAMLIHAVGERTLDLAIIPDLLWRCVYQNAPHEIWEAWAPEISEASTETLVVCDEEPSKHPCLSFEEARQLLQQTTCDDSEPQQILRGLQILARYERNLQYGFGHDQMWVLSFEEIIQCMSEEEIKEMGRLGWRESEGSWSHD